ncbi:unnamed protein product [Paramecium sonneborni]|uniref:Uncharacterized protein n=1 Tax=Paramecium sonneborni TaxID=65129 RepID=A0A8S1ME73_9CILI|nr:unnamed protein product [Paramecium sonneborni]
MPVSNIILRSWMNQFFLDCLIKKHKNQCQHIKKEPTEATVCLLIEYLGTQATRQTTQKLEQYVWYFFRRNSCSLKKKNKHLDPLYRKEALMYCRNNVLIDFEQVIISKNFIEGKQLNVNCEVVKINQSYWIDKDLNLLRQLYYLKIWIHKITERLQNSISIKKFNKTQNEKRKRSYQEKQKTQKCMRHQIYV